MMLEFNVTVLCTQVVEGVLADLESKDAGAWLDRGTEHPHRLALSVRLDCLADTRRILAERFAHCQLQVGRLSLDAWTESEFDPPRAMEMAGLYLDCSSFTMPPSVPFVHRFQQSFQRSSRGLTWRTIERNLEGILIRNTGCGEIRRDPPTPTQMTV